MEKVRELRLRARNCRVKAARASSESTSSHFAELARTWDKLADERLAFFTSTPLTAGLISGELSGSESISYGEPPEAFWGEMSACEHFVQIYDADEIFTKALSGFIGDGMSHGEGAIVIATPQHREQLENRLALAGLDVEAARNSDRFLCLDAQETLDRFMRDGWPDEEKFAEVVRGVLSRAGSGSRRVRAFGEMVALLWAQGYNAATVRLEHLWHQLCQRESFALFCAYPKSGFTENPSQSIARVCAAHSRAFVG